MPTTRNISAGYCPSSKASALTMLRKRFIAAESGGGTRQAEPAGCRRCMGATGLYSNLCRLERLQLVDPNRCRWELVTERVIHRVTLHEYRRIQMLEYGDAQSY